MKAESFSPNPTGDQSKGWTLLAVCWAFVLCAFISTILRVYIRSRITRNLGWDDAVMALAMALTIVGAGMITTEVIYGLGRHMYYLTASQRRLFRAMGWADWIQTFITLALTKISICLFLLRIVDSRRVKKWMYALIGFTILFTAVSVFFFLGICRPLKAYWDVGVEGGCLSDSQVRDIVIAQGVLSIITDLVCAALPVIFLRNLQISKRTKIGLCLLMGLGVITAICCTVRTVLSGAITDKDQSWAISANVAWRLPEVNIGIACANAPVLRPLYLYMRGRLATQQRSKASNSFSKERIRPNNVARIGEKEQQASPRWGGSEDTTVELEMGIAGLHGAKAGL